MTTFESNLIIMVINNLASKLETQNKILDKMYQELHTLNDNLTNITGAIRGEK